ncbi:unnamed protein product [Angiostrongylus costaricensis]|uniref:Methyltransf_21 domain-containing protein n=1 Tax=Angiostrongylus costaricensis TaxID=334426 RepID=A0A0R3PMV9_ANGCS|nr:unnamed protein product [Angiostrongylus costaricensis]
MARKSTAHLSFKLYSTSHHPHNAFFQTNLPSPDERVEKQFSEWKNCIMNNISIYEYDVRGLWSHLWKGVRHCEKLPFMDALAIESFSNSDEAKRHIPSLQNEPSIIVTLGIGHDTAAEEALLKVLPMDSKFYGADPIHEINEELYMKFGKFFPFAVGGKSEVSRASVLANGSYVDRDVVHIEFVHFLSLLRHKVYDDIWIDAEGAEYELFPYFYRGGELDRNGITVCQFNIEVHSPDDPKKEMFREFIFTMLHNNRYAFFRIVQASHIRLYFLNFSDSHCVSKYIFRQSTS